MITPVRVFVTALLALPLLLIVTMFIAKGHYERSFQNDLFRANLTVYQSVNLVTLRDQNKQTYDQSAAQQLFEKNLQVLWDLDSTLNPTSTNKSISSKVKVEQFLIKDQGISKTINGITVGKNPAIVARVSVPVKMPFLENLGEIVIPVTTVTIVPPSF